MLLLVLIVISVVSQGQNIPPPPDLVLDLVLVRRRVPMVSSMAVFVVVVALVVLLGVVCGDIGRGVFREGEPGRGDIGRGVSGEGEPGRGDIGRGVSGEAEPGRGDIGRGDLGVGVLRLDVPDVLERVAGWDVSRSLNVLPSPSAESSPLEDAWRVSHGLVPVVLLREPVVLVRVVVSSSSSQTQTEQWQVSWSKTAGKLQLTSPRKYRMHSHSHVSSLRNCAWEQRSKVAMSHTH